MSSRQRALAPLEVAIGCADNPKVSQALVAQIGAEAASGLMPLESGFREYLVEPLCFGLALHPC